MVAFTKPKWVGIILGLLCTALIVGSVFFKLGLINLFEIGLDQLIYDEIISLDILPHKPNTNIVIIDIDDKSVQAEGRWPWPRDKMAELINRLKEDGVITIGLDIVMAEAEINYATGLKEKLEKMPAQTTANQAELINTLNQLVPKVDNDQRFADSLTDHNVILGYLLNNQPDVKKGILPQAISAKQNQIALQNKLPFFEFKGYNGCLSLFLMASTKAGFVSNLPDSDGTVRNALLLAKYQNKVYPSLALQVAMNYLLVNDPILMVEKGKLYGIQLDGTFIPTNAIGQALIPYWGPPGTLNYYSATDIIKGKVDKKELQGAIALVGSTMTLLADLHESPNSPQFPGTEMLGNMIDAILGQQVTALFDWHSLQGGLILSLIGILFSFLFTLLGINRALLLGVFSIGLVIAGSLALIVYVNWYVPTAFLLTLIGLQTFVHYGFSFINERQQKQKISQLFGQYVPKDYVNELIEFDENYSMDGQTRDMTVQFADIRNFTSISETLDASGVKRLLNTFFTPITEIIFSYRGTIDKYVGDMIVAFWGAPLEDKDHTYHAIMSALKIFACLPDINATMQRNNLPEVKIGMGLASGLMNVGDMGSEFRRAYTVLGDTVNLASRLQDLTKFYQVDILVNDLCRENQDSFVWQPVDKMSVKGRKTALVVYQPLALQEKATPELLSELKEYQNALAAYYEQNWLVAEAAFSRLQTTHPNTYLYQMYLNRIIAYKKTPPPSDWDGVYVHQKY